MYLLLKSKRAKDSYDSQKILLKKIKSVIESNRPKFSGYKQQVCTIHLCQQSSYFLSVCACKIVCTLRIINDINIGRLCLNIAS